MSAAAKLVNRHDGKSEAHAGQGPSVASRRCPPKLTVEQRREAVWMRSTGVPLKAVAKHFGVSPKSIRHLVQSGRYCSGARGAEGRVRPVGAAPAESGTVIRSRAGVDLLVYGLPLSTHRTLEKLTADSGWSVAAFARELLVCSVLPSPTHRAMPIRRVGLRHRVSNWEAAR